MKACAVSTCTVLVPTTFLTGSSIFSQLEMLETRNLYSMSLTANRMFGYVRYVYSDKLVNRCYLVEV